MLRRFRPGLWLATVFLALVINGGQRPPEKAAAPRFRQPHVMQATFRCPSGAGRSRARKSRLAGDANAATKADSNGDGR